MDNAMTINKKKNIKKTKKKPVLKKNYEKKENQDENNEKNINFFNIWKRFKNCDPKFFEETIDDYVEQISNLNDKNSGKQPFFTVENIQMFSKLKNELPYKMALNFLKDYADSDMTVSVHIAFKKFINEEKIKIILKNSKEFLNQRTAIPVLNSKKIIQEKKLEDIVNVIKIKERPEEKTKLVSAHNQKTKVSPVELNDDELKIKAVTALFGTEFNSQCEREFSRAIWMKKFTNKIIRGLAISEKNEFSSNIQLTDEFGKIWYKVNNLFYKNACEKERIYQNNKVAYITSDNFIIIETEEMLNESNKKKLIFSFDPISATSLEIAKEMLKENSLLSNCFDEENLEKFTNEILNSFNILKTKDDLARKISKILIFLSKIIDTPQSFHEKICKGKIQGKDLINLNKFDMLPEIFSKEGTNKIKIENFIKNERSVIEQTFLKLISHRDFIPEAGRKDTRPLKLNKKFSFKENEIFQNNYFELNSENNNKIQFIKIINKNNQLKLPQKSELKFSFEIEKTNTEPKQKTNTEPKQKTNTEPKQKTNTKPKQKTKTTKPKQKTKTTEPKQKTKTTEPKSKIKTKTTEPKSKIKTKTTEPKSKIKTKTTEPIEIFEFIEKYENKIPRQPKVLKLKNISVNNKQITKEEELAPGLFQKLKSILNPTFINQEITIDENLKSEKDRSISYISLNNKQITKEELAGLFQKKPILNPTFMNQEITNDEKLISNNKSKEIIFTFDENLKSKKDRSISYISVNNKQITKEEELAPGLFQKLKSILNPTFQCAKCFSDIKNEKLISVYQKNKVIFCNQKCFDEFNFENFQ